MHFALSLRIFICSVLLLFFKQAFSQKNNNNIQYESFKGIVSKAELNDEIKEKMQQVQQFLSNEKLEGILLSKNNNLSYITCCINSFEQTLHTSCLILMLVALKFSFRHQHNL